MQNQKSNIDYEIFNPRHQETTPLEKLLQFQNYNKIQDFDKMSV